mgnify:CR=1 FL=1
MLEALRNLHRSGKAPTRLEVNEARHVLPVAPRERRARLVRFTYPVEAVVAAVEEREVPGIDPEEYRLGVKR